MNRNDLDLVTSLMTKIIKEATRLLVSIERTEARRSQKKIFEKEEKDLTKFGHPFKKRFKNKRFVWTLTPKFQAKPINVVWNNLKRIIRKLLIIVTSNYLKNHQFATDFKPVDWSSKVPRNIHVTTMQKVSLLSFDLALINSTRFRSGFVHSLVNFTFNLEPSFLLESFRLWNHLCRTRGGRQ